MKSVFMYKFEDYVCLTVSLIDVQRCLQNVNLVLKKVSDGNPVTRIDRQILQSILQEVSVMKDAPDADVWLLDDIKVLFDFCAQNGICLGDDD